MSFNNTLSPFLLAKSGIPINTPFKLFILMDKTPPQLIACEPPSPLKSVEEAEIPIVHSLNVPFPLQWTFKYGAQCKNNN